MKKRYFKALLTMLLCLAVLPFPASALADGGINNQIKGSGASVSSPASGRDLFFTASNYFKIDQPSFSDYYTQPFTCYINAPKGHSVYVYDNRSLSADHQIDAAFHGSRVTVLAAHGDSSCILFFTQDYQLRSAWVRTAYLSAYYPGDELSIGRVLSVTANNIGDPALGWSRDYFVGTGRKYTLLREPVTNCVSFTLDYQVTSRNGAETSEVVGPRDIYINDGSGWTWVGRFQYQNTGACHVNVFFYDLTTIAAVAVIADCAKPDTFVCRQSLLDVMCEGNLPVRPSAPSTPIPQRRGPVPGTYNGNIRDYSKVPFYYAAASSELKEGDILFTASYAIDESINRPWVEGALGAGIGETLTLYFGGTQSIDFLSLRLGYARDSRLYYVNGRPRTIRFQFSDGTWFDCDFADRNEEQIVELGKTINTSYVSMTIMDVYSGEVNDTCIYLVKAYQALFNS